MPIPTTLKMDSYPQSIMDFFSRPILTYTVPLLVAYPVVVSLLRFQRVKELQEKYKKYATREAMGEMSDDEAFEIQKQMIQLEFPFIYIKALQFALFRTYGIPTISHTLTGTKQFSQPENSLKRYSDTAVLIQEFVGQSPSSQRACSAIARTRFLHSGYRTSGKILDSDMLYTLSLFATQPIQFVQKYEWRNLTELEKCAIGTFWKSVGDGLDISYESLPSGKTGFRDGLHWLEEISVWSQEYEAKYMVPDIKNKETADQTTAVLVYMLPKFLVPVGMDFVSYMMDDRLRKAMMYDPPSPLYEKLFSALLAIRIFFLRYLSLPRPHFLRYISFSDHADENDRIFVTKWDAAPYYVKPTIWNRWGPVAWLTWVLGRPIPGDESSKYYPQGYYIPDVGPKYFEGKGRTTLEKTMEELKSSRTGGCPFH